MGTGSFPVVVTEIKTLRPGIVFGQQIRTGSGLKHFIYIVIKTPLRI
jgi:hypothetical protein